MTIVPFPNNPSNFPKTLHERIEFAEELLCDPTQSQSQVVGSYIFLNGLYTLVGNRQAAIECIRLAEPIFFELLELQLKRYDVNNVEFFIDCYLRCELFEEAKIIARRIGDVIRTVFKDEPSWFPDDTELPMEKLLLEHIQIEQTRHTDRLSFLQDAHEFELPEREENGIQNICARIKSLEDQVFN